MGKGPIQLLLFAILASGALSAKPCAAMDYKDGDRESSRVIDRRKPEDRLPKHGEIGKFGMILFSEKIGDYFYGYNQMIIDGETLHSRPQAAQDSSKGPTAKDCEPYVRPLLPPGKALLDRLSPKQDPDVLITPKGATAARLFSPSAPGADACNQQFVDDINWRIDQMVKIRERFERLYSAEAEAADKIATFATSVLNAANKPGSPAYKCAGKIRTFRYKSLGLYHGYRQVLKELKNAEAELSGLATGSSCPGSSSR
jgi:hypothetical protein